MLRLLTLLGILMLIVAPTFAQPGPPGGASGNTCPAFVEVALAEIDQACSGTGRNQACYGNIAIDVDSREGVSFVFEKRGDLAEVLDIDAMTLAALDVLGEVWGVTLMKLQANIPGTLPGQNVTFLLFGDVEIQNLGSDSVALPMTATGSVNIRLRPTTAAQNVVGSLRGGQAIDANGILADGSWIRVRFEGDSRTNTGWVSAEFLATDGDISTLPVVESGEPTYGPMQSFFFKTGIGRPECSTAPDNGILIQTPRGVGRINLQVNGIDVTLGSTMYMTDESGFMYFFQVEGTGTVSFGGVTQFLPPGTFVTVPVDENGVPVGPPSAPIPYDPAYLAHLPLILLPDDIVIAPPPAPDEVNSLVEETQQQIENQSQGGTSGSTGGTTGGGTDAVTPGLWVASRTISESNCPGEDVGLVREFSFFLAQDEDGALYFDGRPMTRVGAGTYTVTGNDPAATNTFTVTFTAPTQFVGRVVSVKADCQYTSSAAGSWAGPG
jgi:hypothetical protein